MIWILPLVLTFGVVAADEAERTEPSSKVCVVSLFGSLKREGANISVNDEIRQDAINQLEALGYKSPSTMFDFKSDSLRSLRDCLQNSQYEDVIVIGHAKAMPNSTYVLADSTSSPSLPVLSRFFENIPISKNLKQFTMIACHTELVEKVYGDWFRRLKEAHVNIRFQPISISADTVARSTPGSPASYRHQRLMGLMIAESAQDPAADTIFCILDQSFNGTNQVSSQSCLRGYYNLEISDSRQGNGRNLEKLYFNRREKLSENLLQSTKKDCSPLSFATNILDIAESSARLSSGEFRYFLSPSSTQAKRAETENP